MNVPAELLYTRTHEWVRFDGDVATVGITDFAQTELGDVVYVELPSTGKRVEAEEVLGTVESVKAVSDIYAPVAGEVVEVNTALNDRSELVNSDPYGDGWMVRLRVEPDASKDHLLSAEGYLEHLQDLEQ